MVVYHAGGERTKCDDMFSRFDTIRVCNGRIVRTMHTRRAVKTAQHLSVGISRGNCFHLTRWHRYRKG